MQQSPEPACLAIADISGYTSYLAGVELDHAQDIIADLMQTVVKALRPFKLAKLEGDAAFVYAPTSKIDGSALQDRVEATYFAFRKRLRDIRQSTICECNACTLLPRLDLKFVIHHGTVARQKMAGHEELVGRDVILVHRLLKNAVEARLGGHAYALYTDDCARAMGMDLEAQGLSPQVETIDFIGEVKAWVKDLEVAWQAREAGPSHLVGSEKAFAKLSYEIAAPRDLVWEYLTDPGLRSSWQAGAGVTGVREFPGLGGRRGAGTTNHCMHGKDAVIEEILDWHPPQYQTVRSVLPYPDMPPIVTTDFLGDGPNGSTRLEIRVEKPRAKDKQAFEQILPQFREMYDAAVAGLRRSVEAEAVRRRELLAGEPDLPVSHSRFATGPVSGSASADRQDHIGSHDHSGHHP